MCVCIHAVKDGEHRATQKNLDQLWRQDKSSRKWGFDRGLHCTGVVEKHVDKLDIDPGNVQLIIFVHL